MARVCPFCLEPLRECICDEDDEMAEGVAQAWHSGDEDGAA